MHRLYPPVSNNRVTVNDELERKWKKVLMDYFILSGGTEEN
jgi:hypothetical protein